jgi:hypothetical protein
MNGGDQIAEVLKRQGVRFLFTLCGGHISPILVGAKRRDIRVIDVRHEVNAVFAVARLTGIPGVAAVTAGPGVTNTITAIKNAQMAQSPVIAVLLLMTAMVGLQWATPLFPRPRFRDTPTLSDEAATTHDDAIGGVEAACVDWLQHADLRRDQLLQLMLGALQGALASAYQVDPIEGLAVPIPRLVGS